ncbi:MAG TPA: hypothetical protein DEH78_05875 [Solibacterales bacterium]|nr:hypothetical protein [Bryobacterales bacterium]
MGNQTIKGKVTVGKTTFEYNEVKYGSAGGGNRGLKIWRQGVADDTHEYKFSPNPHDSKKYNKKQDSFYLEAATQIATLVNAGAYPAFNTTLFTFDGIAFQLVAP